MKKQKSELEIIERQINKCELYDTFSWQFLAFSFILFSLTMWTDDLYIQYVSIAIMSSILMFYRIKQPFIKIPKKIEELKNKQTQLFK